MPDANALPSVACPNCRQPMQTQDMPRTDHGEVRVELCFTCAGIWFDHLASVQLAPGAVLELFREIQAHRDTPRRPVASQLACPRCEDALTLSYDLVKSGRFSYFRCPRGDGRFTPFFQFLREKQFVRSLTPAELQHVRSQVRQITCSECGAPIDLEHASQCQYCHAPVSFLDPDAMQKSLHMWSDAEHRRESAPTPEALAEALLRVQMQHAQQPGMDLVTLGIHALGSLFG